MTTIHSFQESLSKSQAQEDAPWWPRVYSLAFPGHLSAVSVRSDGWAQRGGVDRVVTLASGKTVTIDEKVRYESYSDILLETWSSVQSKSPGWMQKDLACDFIAYAFVPDERCYLFSFPILRCAWLKHGREWIREAKESRNGFRVVNANNGSYTTRSIAVPIPELMGALHDAQVISWEATG